MLYKYRYRCVLDGRGFNNEIINARHVHLKLSFGAIFYLENGIIHRCHFLLYEAESYCYLTTCAGCLYLVTTVRLWPGIRIGQLYILDICIH